MIKKIPNILTSIRIISIPFIIIFFALNKIEIAIILSIFTAITDCFDGFIARKFNATSEFGAKLDAVSDKFFAGGLLITLSIKFPFLLISVLFELLISITNLYYYFKKEKPKTIIIGKIKTIFLFISVILGFISCFKVQFIKSMYILLAITIILQVITLVTYIKKGIKKSSNI